MATTFSQLLRLALQGTGDNPNTWGQIANQQVFELIESAISGYETVDVTGSSDITLSVGNGVPDQSRAAMIELTGFPIADINVNIPTVPKIYLLRATFTGTNTVTVKTSSGTGVTLTSGAVRHVFCDGTDVIEVLPELGALAYKDTIDDPSLIASGVVDGGSLVDGSLAVSKLEAAARGSVITFNASGLPVVVSAGSPGTVLTVTGSEPAKTTSFQALPTASATQRGTVELATTAEVQAGTDTTRAITPAALKAAAGFTKYYESALTTFGAQTVRSFNHGLGQAPTLLQVEFVCQTAERGFSPGDVFTMSTQYQGSGRGISSWYNSTQVGVGFGEQFIITGKNGSGSYLTPANWRLRIRAWA